MSDQIIIADVTGTPLPGTIDAAEKDTALPALEGEAMRNVQTSARAAESQPNATPSRVETPVENASASAFAESAATGQSA